MPTHPTPFKLSAQPATASGHKHGFALVIAISLMAFVLLLCLSMSTLVKVESSSAHMNSARLHAKSNALLGLKMAMGELGKLAGPDQRITARADILTDQSTPSGASVQSKSFYTGVWSTEDVSNGGDIKFLNWLVSGSPTDPTNPTWHSNELSDQRIQLVGANSVGNSPDTKVEAELVPIVAPSGNTSGHYAYWIGDEGVKAKVNMLESEAELATNPSSTAEFNRLHAIQRFDINLLKDESGIDYDNVDDRTLLTKLISNAQLSSQSTSFLKDGYHDYTLYSQGLLTNALEGGLKTDLTRGLDDQPLSGTLYPQNAGEKPAPNWETLRSYYGLKDEVSGDQISVRTQTDTTQGVYPVILNSDTFFGLYFDELDPDGIDEADDEFQLNLIMWTALVLHNPYDIALEATDYIFETTLPEELPNKKFEFYLKGEWTKLNRYYFDENVEALTGEKTRYIRYGSSTPLAFAPGEVKVVSTQTPVNFAIDGIYNHENMPEGAKVMTPGYQESVGFLSIPLTKNIGNNNHAPDGKYTRSDLFTQDLSGDWTNPKTISFSVGAYITTNLYAMHDGAEEYIGGLAAGGIGGGGSSSDYQREVILNQPIGMRGSIIRTMLPRSSEGSGYRLLADFNYRAMKEKDIEGFFAVPTQMQAAGRWWYDQDPVNNYLETDPNQIELSFAGRSKSSDGFSDITFFAIPREAIFSLGDLRHANLRKERYQDPDAYADEIDTTIPSYVIGNSWASHFSSLDRADYTYRVNEALWDQYFFSSIPKDTSDWTVAFPNSRIQASYLNPNDPDEVAAILDRDTAAAYLSVDGAFNVNSTSVKAWRALLGGLSELVDDPDSTGEKLDNIFPRITNWSHKDYRSGDIAGDDTSKIHRMWSGMRSLTDEEIDALAEEIVKQVKLRGPFASLASFVNRTLVDKDATTSPDPAPSGYSSRLRVLVDQHDTRLKGTLQAAIDNVDINDDGLPDINEDLRKADYLTSLGNAPSDGHQTPLGIIDSLAQREVGLDQPPKIRPDYRSNSRGYYSTDAPGFLSQTDLLSALAPLLTVRSDTFTIRSYGESLNSVTGEVESRTWCEATVQRTSTPLDENNAAEARQFQVVNFRWLNEDEI